MLAVIALAVGATVVIRQHAARSQDGVDHASTAAAGPGYSFMRTNPSGSPTRWNPCTPIHVRANLTEAPPNAPADLGEALQLVADATGLTFVDDGSTSVIPSTHYGADATGRPKPVVIAWATASETDGLQRTPVDAFGPHELGRGGASARVDALTGHGVYVSGSVVIDADASARLQPGFGPGGIGVLLLHELGHLVGLGHVNDPTQIMNPVLQPTKSGEWGTGDLAGLARLGMTSGCLKVPSGRVTVL